MFFLHFVADFLFQPRKMGRQKGKRSLNGLKYLALHLLIQFLTFLIGLSLIWSWDDALVFAVLNTVIHGIIDALIWKGYAQTIWLRRRNNNYLTDNNKKTWKYWDDQLFYVFIGLDQFLHFTTIVFLWYTIVGGGSCGH